MRTARLTVALVAVTSLALTACGRDSGGSTASETAEAVSSGKAKGEITVWAIGAEGEKLPGLVKKFEAANPGVKVKVTPIPWDGAYDKFTSAIAAGTTPDAAMVGSTWMGEFAGQGALDPTPSSIDSEAFFPGAQGTTEVNDTSYGVPWYVETRMMFYRKDLAKKAGYESVPKDWAKFQKMTKDMQTKAGAKFGLGLQPGGQGSWQSVFPFAWSNGAEVTADGGSKYNFDSPEMLEALKYYQSFFTKGISDKGAARQPTTEPDFVSGKVPMFISGPWMMSAVEKLGGKGFANKYDVAPVPAKDKSVSFVGGANLVVFKKAKNRDAAWKLLSWLSEPKTQVAWYKSSTDLPSVQSAWDDPSLAGDDKLGKFRTALETAKAPPNFPTWEKVVSGFDSQVEKVTRQGADPAKALKEAQRQAESAGTGQ